MLVTLFVMLNSEAGPALKWLSVSVQQGNALRVLAQEPGIQMIVYSLAGQKVAEGQSPSNQLTLAFPRRLADGVYLYVITVNQNGSPRRVVGKFVVLRGRTIVQSPIEGALVLPRPRIEDPVKPQPGIQQQEASKPIFTKFSEADAQSALEYWTEERMRNAKPLEIVLPGNPSPVSDDIKLLTTNGREGRVEGEVPTIFLNEADRLFHQSGAATAPLANWTGPPWPYNRFRMPLNPHFLYPARTIGKLYFTIPGQGDYVCSAAVVTSANDIKRLVWTAGHCVVSPGPIWHTNVIFVPARLIFGSINQPAPLGIFTAAELWSINGWAIYGSLRYDFGAIVVNRTPSGHFCGTGARIANCTGSLGFIWNLQYQQDFHAIGYPHASPFNGDQQHVCTAGEARQDMPGSLDGPATTGIGCDLTGGASGGPWVTRAYPQRSMDDPLHPNMQFYMGCVTCYVSGVNSYRYVNQPRELFSPYCGTSNGCQQLWDAARNSDP